MTIDIQQWNLAQVNIASMKAPIDSPLMSSFVARLDEINALAEASPGFVWRLKSDDGNATSIRAYDDERILFNLSVWQDVETLQHYVYKTMHVEVMKQRKQWFDAMGQMHYALWWVRRGHTPSVTEARERLGHLQQNGPSAHAFGFAKVFEVGCMVGKLSALQ
jgi:hypothetical protein